MTEEHAATKQPHNLILQNRKDLSVSGVTEVVSFDENTVVLITALGELTVRGFSLHISKTSVETGEVVLDGEIHELLYTNPRGQKQSGSIFARMFRG